ncbi:mating pheromone receptor Bbr2 [Schizophyllum commune]
MADATFPLFPIASFLAFVLSLVPLTWHVQAWNSGTCAYMLWTATACLMSFVNSIVWKGNAIDVAPVWCDISSKLLLGASIGIPASGLCISRRLYKISSVRTVSITRKDKIRAIMVDLSIAVGIPVVIMILHVVVQPHRYDILEDVGCYAALYNTLPAYFLVLMWPLVLGTISFVFSALCLRAFYIRRLQFAQILAHNTSLNTSRYMRLMSLAILDMSCTIPLCAVSIYLGNYGVQLAPWISWDDTHYNFGRVGQIPALVWRTDRMYEISVEMTRWLPVACGFLFFGLFGFADEAMRHYKQVLAVVEKKVGLAPDSKLRGFKLPHPKWNDSKGAKGGLPVYASPAKDSADAFAARKKELYGTPTTDTFLSSTNASTFTFDPEKGVPLPSSPATTAPPPEYEFHERDLPDVPVNVGRLSIDFQVVSPSSSSSSSSSKGPSSSSHTPASSAPSSPTSPDSHIPAAWRGSVNAAAPSSAAVSFPPPPRPSHASMHQPPHTSMQQPSRTSMHQPSHTSLRSQTLPQHQRSQSSLRSLATSLASSGADVIYIYDAYQDDEEVGRRESLPPFSNLEPAPASTMSTTTTATQTPIADADEARQPAHSVAARQARYSRRPATPLPPLFVTRRTEEA